MKTKLPYLKTWIHKPSGKIYARFRRKGFPEVQLPGVLSSDEMMAAYWAARNCGALPAEPITNIGASRLKPGSTAAVVGLFLETSSFIGKADGTAKRRRSVLEKFREQNGERAFALLDRKFIERAVDSLGGGHAAKNWLKAIRPLCQFAMAQGFHKCDPTDGIKISVEKSDGHATWEEDHIANYRAHWALGTKQRLALELLLNTGQRTSDVVRMGRQFVRNGVMRLTQVKRTKAGQAKVEIPMHPDLEAAIAVTATGDLTYLLNEWGRPFPANAFSNWFSLAAQAAGLPQGYTAHGLRKGCCRRLAELDCSAPQIMAITGHRTLAEVQRYIDKFNRVKAAASGMAKLIAGSAELEQNGTQSGKSAEPRVANLSNIK